MSSTMIFSKKVKSPDLCILYGENFLEQVNNTNMSLNMRISERCQTVRNALFAMASLEVQGLKPLDPPQEYTRKLLSR